jgi:inhibitor of cysteine peptidase
VGFLLVSLVAGCTTLGAGLPPRGETPDDEAPSGETPGELVYGEADVDEVEILMMESFPIQVAVVARGNLRDGCTEIDEVTTTYDEENKTFDVDITTVRDPDAMCTQALVPFEERVDLDVRGLPAGTYTVDVNGVSETFTFDVDNEIPEEAGTDIEWEEARELILAGEVAQVTQLHSLEVTLELKDGRQLVTMEPEIDAVFDVVDECGEPCSDIVLATE